MTMKALLSREKQREIYKIVHVDKLLVSIKAHLLIYIALIPTYIIRGKYKYFQVQCCFFN